MPSGKLQAGKNDAVGGDADGEERSGRGGGVDGGAVVVLQEVAGRDEHEVDGWVFESQAAMYVSFVAHKARTSVGIEAPGR